MAEVPETRFAETPGGRIAYEVVGDDGVDLLVAHPFVFPIDLMWDEPTVGQFLGRLSTFSRTIWFDPRGRGASDPVPHVEGRLAESVADDMLALVDHLGCEQVALLGLGGTPAAILFAAAQPERTKALVLFNTTARLQPPDSYTERWARFRRDWGTGALMDFVAPSAAGDARLRRWMARCERLLGTADEVSWRALATLEVDLRPVLSSVQVPTLVLYREGVELAGQARYVADHIAGAIRVELSGEDMLFFLGETGPMLDAIEEFLTGQLPAHRSTAYWPRSCSLTSRGLPSTRRGSATAAGRRCLPPMTRC